MFRVMDLRTSFIDFFRLRDHRIVPSSSLIPKDDPTLLFTTAGMVQFKPMFAGVVELEYTRAASVQKCLRTSDLEKVGKTKRHLTFFEMLGNFSFGDYFKKEAIEYAWEYSTSIIGFKPEDIWVSVYQEDDEAFEIWHRRIGIPSEKIVRLGKEDNFWGPAGDSGACGPCSELYIDRGPSFGCGKKDCKPGCDCERFLEYWNLVFNQFNQDVTGALHPLSRPGIDTGMGLERLATLVQNVDSVYETDEFASIIRFVMEQASAMSETVRGGAGEVGTAVRIITEHARALTFALADGVFPSNEGRGYVLRRILRRAMRFSRHIGIREPFIYKVVDPIVETMGGFYPEICEAANHVRKVIESEEQRFLETLENGMDRLDEIVKSLKKQKQAVMSGRDAFILHDTFGFPLEMTMEIAQESGIAIDVEGYEIEMEKQRERGKQSWKSAGDSLLTALRDIGSRGAETVFTGYEHETEETRITLIHNGASFVDRLGEGERGTVVLESTPFYGEAGGQVGDVGILESPGAIFRVEDTQRSGAAVAHIGTVLRGEIRIGDAVHASIDVVNRNLIRANHTVTHLLHAALRLVIGTHVRQAGSLVSPDRMRFDFSHFAAMTEEEIERVESIVNEKIWLNIPVETTIMAYRDAIAAGAMAVFDEKYGDMVRVVSVGDFSRELCGGTHAFRTGQIGAFTIVRESSPGAGMRRIEAVTLKGLLERMKSHERIVADCVRAANVSESALSQRVWDLVKRVRTLEKELEQAKKKSLSSGVDELLSRAEVLNGVTIVSHAGDGLSVDDLRAMADAVRAKVKDSVVLLGAKNDDKAVLLFAATNSAVSRGIDCGTLVKESVRLVGGGGGGRKDMAQAGGKSPEGLERALALAVTSARSMIQRQ